MYGEGEECKMWFTFPAASTSMTVLENQGSGMMKDILSDTFLRLSNYVYKLVWPLKSALWRGTKPVYCIEGRIVDFELEAEKDETKRGLNSEDCKSQLVGSAKLGSLINSAAFVVHEKGNNMRDLSTVTLQS